jgi:hypothetical protein
MTLSIDGYPGDVSRRVTYLSASSPARPAASAGKAKRLDDPWANQMESQVIDLKRRIPILKRLHHMKSPSQLCRSDWGLHTRV